MTDSEAYIAMCCFTSTALKLIVKNIKFNRKS